MTEPCRKKARPSLDSIEYCNDIWYPNLSLERQLEIKRLYDMNIKKDMTIRFEDFVYGVYKKIE